MSQFQPASTPQYYPHIDGLRALAVLSVLIFHLNSDWLAGGFLGVDVFFVISGFVVSASLGTLDRLGFGAFLSFFYARRLRRIIPALVVCLMVTAFLSALFIPKIWLSGVNHETGLYAFFGLSNFILASSGRDYFAPTTDFNPYTHTWSLAVEEQFYLLFPVIFWLWLRGDQGRYYAFRITLAIVVVSLVVAGWQTQVDPIKAYFLTPSRLWELACGVCLYQASVLYPEHFAQHTRLKQWLVGLSLCVLLAAFVVVPKELMPLPGALPAVIATLGLLYGLHAGSSQASWTRHALCHPKIIDIGKISYSLYLWHWPVFVLFRWTCGLDTLLTQLIAGALAFWLAWISYQWIEQPFRQNRIWVRLPRLATIACALLMIVGGWAATQQIIKQQPALSLSQLSLAPTDWYPHGDPVNPDYPGCSADAKSQGFESGVVVSFTVTGCVQERVRSKHRLFVIGDSHALAYEGLLRQYAIQQNMEIRIYSKGGCALISLQPWNDNTDCLNFMESVLASLPDLNAQDVVFLPALSLPRLSDQWASFGDLDQASQGMLGAEADQSRQLLLQKASLTLRKFTAQHAKVVLEAPKPLYQAPPFRCGDWFNQSNPICRVGFSLPKADLERFRQPVLLAFKQLAERIPGVSLWDPFPRLCAQDYCSAWEEGKPLFIDGDHLSGYGNRVLLPEFSAYLQNL